MIKGMSWLAIAIIVLAIVLFVVLLNFIIRVALLALIVLGIIWLWKQIERKKRKR